MHDIGEGGVGSRLGEQSIERLLGRKVRHSHKAHLALPFRVRLEHLVCFGLRTHRPRDSEAALHVVFVNVSRRRWMGRIPTSMRMERI